MSLRKLLLFVILLPHSLTIAFGQTSSLSPASGRDPKAVQVLASALAQSGYPTNGSLRDFTAIGKTTYRWAGTEMVADSTIRSRWPDGFRIDSRLPNGNTHWLSARTIRAKSKFGDAVNDFPLENAINLQALSFPMVRLADALLDPSTQIAYVGLLNRAGQNFHVIRVTRQPFQGKKVPEILRLSTSDYEIADGTFLVVALEMNLKAVKSTAQSIPARYEYSNYKSVSGILAPFEVTEYLAKQKTWTTNLDTLTFNVGLTDSDFDQ